MQLISTIFEIKERIEKEKTANKTIGFVPTMGYFHHGHTSLMEKAKEENDVVIVSIFVNPTQFAPNEDFQNYPRDLERDIEIAKEAQVDYIFNPSAKEIYKDNFQTSVNVGEKSKYLCAVKRVGHFEGVTTVVAKLFNIVNADRAYFGLKDYQQYRIIEQMVSDLNIDIEVKACSTVRDEDGLAASSRNSYLTYEERDQATGIYKALQGAKALFEAGTDNGGELITYIAKTLDKRPLLNIEYIEIVDRQSLLPVFEVLKGKSLIAIAVRVGKARLIDNLEV